MLSSFSIRNFRLFQSIEVKRLSRVNLIVGKNNSGKSAFLEAVQVYASNASPAVIFALINSRQETWARGGLTSIRHLFFGHVAPGPDGDGIALGELSSPNDLRLTVAAFRLDQNSDGSTNFVRLASLETDAVVYLVSEQEDRTRRLLNLGGDLPRRGRLSLVAWEPRCPWQLVPTGSMDNRKIASLWDLTSLTDFFKDAVIQALRMIEPRVEGVAFVEDLSGQTRIEERVPLVKLAGEQEPLPLKSMGDGMTRLFHIIVSLVNARGGLLLVDEFENGLHWSIQPLVWEVIFRVAERLNVQVFATTHSRDCIQGFDQAWSKNVDQGAFFRLDIKNEAVRVKEYTAETLADALETEVEVR